MFGTLRFILALMVMVSHLFFPVQGTYAVFSFYILSGYLMTFIMHENYGYHNYGKAKFAVNRILRLFPMYWIAAIFTIVLVDMVGSDIAIKYHGAMFIPHDIKSIFENMFMIFPKAYSVPRLVPPTWALTVEMFYYLLICAGASKTFYTNILWFLISVSYVLITFFLDCPPGYRYFPIPAGALPFSIGGLIYYVSPSEKWIYYFKILKLSTNKLLVAMIINMLLWQLMYHVLNNRPILELGFYLNIIICATLIYSIVVGGNMSFISKRADAFIGDLSYPVYLMHWQVGLLVSFILFGSPLHGFSTNGLISLIVSIPVVILLSIVLIYLVDHPIQAIRQRIKYTQHPTYNP